MIIEQRIRAILFYLSVIVFFAGLPTILSLTLGYKFDTHSFKFTKTGLIFVKTQPPGADVYLNDNLLNEKTPVTINELLPGNYDVRVELDRYSSWESGVSVQAGKVSRFDKIILFPLRPDVKQLNRERLSTFWIDAEEKKIYFVNHEDNAIYSSDLEGEKHQIAGTFLPLTPPALKYKLSPDKEKLLYFNKHQIGIAFLAPYYKGRLPEQVPFIVDYAAGGITDVFWYSDSFHIILISDKKIEAMEAKPDSSPVELFSLNKKSAPAYFDEKEDALYFLDYQKAEDGNFYNNLYKLDLSARFSPLKDLIKIKTGE